ncbi:HAMP domain-containing protein [Pseudenhygromyxa sp. WMMC2535]|uniref:sensor histidine kinase n=1 Tax=Pseudenhygromyxa sp. WMMC2535 TaxID=2712867 RepID=UPI001552C877|nr:ATP-binding protein [Pseudenhygromyxa sp. WMMC2535]NVB40958.1 HAMP domain-containing protein [Pseudenhygromyxa sp. WMMC2535]
MPADKQKSARERAPRGGARGGRTRGTASFHLARALQQRPPWWGRLEARITISLVAIGILCVSASGYLVALAVGYYDRLDAQQAATQREAIELAQPYYAELAAAQREVFQARTELLAHDVEALLGAPGQPVSAAALERALQRWIDARWDVLEVVVERPGGDAIALRPGGGDAALGDAAELGPLAVAIVTPLEVRASAGEGEEKEGEAQPRGELAARLRVSWATDPAVIERHQRLGELARSVGTVEIRGARGEDRSVARSEIQRAVITAISLASGLVLIAAVIAGLIIARQTTRKVSDLSKVMRQVASGDLSARAPRLGHDELGLLATAFNTMLDELEHTRRRIAYLQRVGAWQEMARRIAHEIKNPLTPIQLAVQQLREKDPGQDPRFSKLLDESVEIVEDEVESLRRMVTSFSQFAKLPEVALEQVSLERVLAEFERAYGGTEPGLVVEAPEGAGARGSEALEIRGDRQLLKQVLVNLVENAALSAREAGVEAVEILVRAGLVPGREDALAYLAVEDNGPGVPPRRRELVFEPYETTRSQGTGLGLAIVKKIVLDHGGEVSVGESELGGARFEVRLPLVRDA